MGVRIDGSRCVLCGSCVKICPGNLIRISRERGAAYLKRPGDCWSCGSCMKECAAGAIWLELPRQMGGRGTVMHARRRGEITEWEIHRGDGVRRVLLTNSKEANQY